MLEEGGRIKTTCTTMFDAHAHGMFEVGDNIKKCTKRQVWEDATQSIDSKYEMLQSSMKQLYHMT